MQPARKGGVRPSPAPESNFATGITSGGIELSDAQYKKLAELVYSLSGIHLGDGKRELLKARLAKRFRATACPDLKTYLQRLKNDTSGQELVGFLDVITTNKTDFFREPQHFDFLASEALPKLAGPGAGSGPLRVWSAACSTGEEPYTLGMVLMENRSVWAGRGATILASDLSTQVLAHAKRGIYANDRCTTIPRPYLTRYFQRGVNRWEGHVRVRPQVRDLVDFQRVNLMDPFRFERPFQVIFCRNVMIYFDKDTQTRLVNKFHDCLAPGGYLMVGHSESLTGIKHRLRFVKPAIYQREG